MSIRLRFTLLYNAILALTLALFGIALYSIQSHATYDALKNDLVRSSSTLGASVLQSITNPGSVVIPPDQIIIPQTEDPQSPKPFENFSNDKAFKKLPEREIVRILNPAGKLVASPFGRSEDVLPLSADGLSAVQTKRDWWQEGTFLEQRMLIYNHPIVSANQLTYIIQVARPLTERDRTLKSLGMALLVGSLLTIVVAFGIGWVLSGVILAPIQRMTHTARAIGNERDFTRRVAYNGPQDEVGELASTFNIMLARLQDGYQQVAHSLEMQRDFVADVSHELRTPLTTLRGNLGLLRRSPAIPQDEQSDILSDMTEESDRMIRLVNDLLVLARADAGRSLAKESFAVLPVLEETCRQARQLDPQREITLKEALSDFDLDVSILGDRDAFRQVLLVALDNALKHTQGKVCVGVARLAGQVEIRVQDESEGMSVEKLEHLFDRFYRGEDSVTIPGFGLGLPIARSLVNAMGGEIRMESEPGSGSTLVMTFGAKV